MGEVTAGLHGGRTRPQKRRGGSGEGADGEEPEGGDYDDADPVGEDGNEWVHAVATEGSEEEIEVDKRPDGCVRRHLAFVRSDWLNRPFLACFGPKNPYWAMSKNPRVLSRWASHLLRAERRLDANRGDDQDEILCSRLKYTPSTDENESRRGVKEGKVASIANMEKRWRSSVAYTMALSDDEEGGAGAGLAPEPAASGHGAEGAGPGGPGVGAGALRLLAGEGGLSGAGGAPRAPLRSELVEPDELRHARDLLSKWEEGLVSMYFPQPPLGRRLVDAKAELVRVMQAREVAPAALPMGRRGGGGLSRGDSGGARDRWPASGLAQGTVAEELSLPRALDREVRALHWSGRVCS